MTLAALRADLIELRMKSGNPPLRAMAKATPYAVSTVHAAFAEDSRVPSWEVVEEIVKALGGDVSHFRELYEQVPKGRLHIRRNDTAEIVEKLADIAAAIRELKSE